MISRLENFPAVDSPLGRLDPRWKLAAILLAIVAILLLRDPLTLLLGFSGSMVLVLLSGISPRWFLLRIGIVALLLAPFAALLPFLVSGNEQSWWLAAVRLYAKALATVALAVVLLATAPPATTLKAAHALHVPGILIHLVMLTYRYIFVLAQELRRMRTGLRVRGYRVRANRHSYRTTGHLAGTMLVRGYERAERVGQAMRCRGFDGKFRSLERFQTRPADIAFFLLLTGFAVLLCAWDYVLS